MAIETFFCLQKLIFFLIVRSLPLPLLMAWSLVEERFFAASLHNLEVISNLYTFILFCMKPYCLPVQNDHK